MLKVAILSFWHVHAKDYAKNAIDHPDTEIVAIWDEVPERGRQKAEEYGVRFVEHLHELLAQPDLDAVIVTTPTNMHREVMIAAAQARKHIFTEKVVATTTEDCQEIMSAVEAAGVKLVVSLPRMYMAFTQAIQQILDDGLLGKLTLVRLRLAHNGALRTEKNPNGALPAHFFNMEQSGGGALMDLGCHPMYLARLFLGFPDSLTASFGSITEREVDDSAVVVLRYPNGAMGIVEAGFVNSYSQFNIELQGTEGSLTYSRQDDKVWVRGSRFEGAATEWKVKEDMPASLPSAFEMWVSHIHNGSTATENLEMALDLTRLMEAAYLSASSETVVKFGNILYASEKSHLQGV